MTHSLSFGRDVVGGVWLLFGRFGKFLISTSYFLLPRIYGGSFTTLVIFACPIACHILIVNVDEVNRGKITEKPITSKILKVKSMQEKERVVFVDYVRVVAPLLVMLVHASENFYAADSSGLAGSASMLANESNRFWVAFWDGGVSRCCVPLFMMISAYLLVPMKSSQTMSSFYKRRFLHILPPFITFLVAYSLIPLLWGAMDWEQSVADLKSIPWNFTSMSGILWFMYPLISLYLIIPIVSPWLEKSKPQEELCFIALFVISTFMPFLRRFVQPELWGECFWNHFHMLWYCSGYLGYLVLAHYIRVHLTWSVSKRLWVGLISFLVGAFFTGWSFWWKGVPGVLMDTPEVEWAWEFCLPNVLLSTFGAFLLFSCIRQQKAPGWITQISKMSYGMYLMHMLFLAPIASYIVNGDQANPLIPVWLAIPVIAVISYVCCVITTKIISLLPGSKWIIGC